ncbi:MULTISPECIES: AcrID1 family anti-CRISPR protein [Bacteria]|uniref:Uncharacterized protein n=3 Tax=root TaxID=1 RepID=A0A1B3SN09_9VIRU|nr:AcrID1 family anti-CRISPR protein [Sulfolobus islandicus]YP_009272959.1 AcrID1 family anti-CRISPR protein [Sulfolobus islandicus rudivirus 3]AOG61567.1 hypothetical protein [Sulfolobus islandicus rod-shaped virus 3]
MEFEDLDVVLYVFFENQEMKSFEFEFKELFEITENGLRYLVGVPDSRNKIKSNSEIIEEFIYYQNDNIVIKLTFYYTKDTNKIYIRKIYGWREKRSESENEEDNI